MSNGRNSSRPITAITSSPTAIIQMINDSMNEDDAFFLPDAQELWLMIPNDFRYFSHILLVTTVLLCPSCCAPKVLIEEKSI